MKKGAFVLLLLLLLPAGCEALFRVFAWPIGNEFFVAGSRRGTLVSNVRYFDPRQQMSVNPVEMARQKPKDTKRVFLLGESTMAGVPFNPHVTIGKWLDGMFKEALPSQKIEVINAGISGVSSDTILRVFHEVLRFEPDLLVVYSGQNEFLEPNVRAIAMADQHPKRTRMRQWLLRSRVISWLWVRVEIAAKKMLPRRNMTNHEMFVDPFFGAHGETVRARYRERLTEMALLAREQGVPFIFLTPFSNERDWEPSASYFSKAKSPAEKKSYEMAINEAREAIDTKKFGYAQKILDDLALIDSKVAEWQWQRGRLFEKLGEWQSARKAYQEAIALDAYPWRSLPTFPDVVRQIAAEYGAVVVDSEGLLRSHSPHGLIGNDLLVDNCHPNIEGQGIIAQGILAVIREREILAPGSQFQDLAKSTWAERIRQLSLDPLALAQGSYRIGAYILPWSSLRYDRKLRIQQASQAFAQALKLDPDLGGALYAQAQCLKFEGKMERAKSLESRALKIDPKIGKRLSYMAKILGV